MADFTSGTGSGYLQLSMQEVGYDQGGNYSIVNWQFYLVCNNGQSWNANPVGWSANIGGQGYGGSYTFDFRGNNVKLIASGQVGVGHDGNGYGSCYGSGYTAHTGTSAIGGPWSVGGTIGLVRIPKPPGAPGISIASASAHNVSLTVTAPGDNGGSGITQYTVQYSRNGGAWTGDQYGGSCTYTGLAPGSYVFRAFATNGVGSGPASQTGAITILPGGKRFISTADVTDLQIIRRFDGATWKDMAINKRYVDAAAGWVDLGYS